jgi:hypothetical protein
MSTIFPYPEGTPYRENKAGTYWPALNPNAQKAFDYIQEWLQKNNIDLKELSLFDVDQRLTVLRYLRANKFDTKKTCAHVEKNIQWRKTMKVTELITMRPEAILGFSLERFTAVFPHWHYGFDKTGRPVLYKQYGKFDASKIKKLSGGNFDRVIQYHVWEQEACARLCKQQSLRLGYVVETFVGIVDVKDMRVFQITRDFLALTRAIADVDQGQYPETLGRIYVVNAPSAFPTVYAMIRPWLDPVVAAKILVLGGPKEYEPVLFDYIGKENLPANYGGDLPAMTPTMHPYSLTMVEYDNIGAPFAQFEHTLKTVSSSSEMLDFGMKVDEELTEDQMHQLEEMVAETRFSESDNTNHTAADHLVVDVNAER